MIIGQEIGVPREIGELATQEEDIYWKARGESTTL